MDGDESEFCLPCPPPEEDDLGTVVKKKKPRSKTYENLNSFWWVPQHVLKMKENGRFLETRLRPQLESRGKVFHTRMGKLLDELGIMDALCEDIDEVDLSSAEEGNEFEFLSDSSLDDNLRLKNVDDFVREVRNCRGLREAEEDSHLNEAEESFLKDSEEDSFLKEVEEESHEIVTISSSDDEDDVIFVSSR